MKSGIVILNYNSYKLSCELVKKCEEIKLIDTIVLIDNNSNDDFTSFLKTIDNNKIVYIKNNQNNGYAAGNNIGLKYLYKNGFDFAFVANPDVIFDCDTVKSIVDFLNKNNNYAVATTIRTQNQSKNTGQFWSIPTFKDSLMESLFIGRKLLGNYHKKYSNYVCDNSNDYYIDVDVVGGAFFGCNLSILEKIGWLDENTFLWYEENILATKIKKAGYKTAVILNALYEHNHKKVGRGNLKHSIFVQSKKYYCEEYLKINMFQKILLNIFDCIGLLENKIICLIFKRSR